MENCSKIDTIFDSLMLNKPIVEDDFLVIREVYGQTGVEKLKLLIESGAK